jgi:acyl-CoA thioester hydrolase
MNQNIRELLKDYPVVVSIPIAWGEMDALQHVNNIVYFRYFETARLAYFEKIKFMDTAQRGGVGPILAETSCKFRKPLTYPDTVWIGVRASITDVDRFTMSMCLVSEKLEKIAAEGAALIVSYDYRAKRKTALPEEIRRNIEAIEGSMIRNP